MLIEQVNCVVLSNSFLQSFILPVVRKLKMLIMNVEKDINPLVAVTLKPYQKSPVPDLFLIVSLLPIP